MSEITLKPCPWGCGGSTKVYSDDLVMCGVCSARGPSADKLSKFYNRKAYDTYSMANAVARALWNLRGPNLTERAKELVVLSSQCRSSEEFKRKYAELAGGSPKSNWMVALRSYKTLTEGVEYQVKDHTTACGKRMFTVLDAEDNEVQAPEDVFLLVLA